MGTIIRPAVVDDVKQITALVNRFATKNIMLPRSEANVEQTISDWLVAAAEEAPHIVVGCGALVPLNDTLVEVRSLAIDESQHGKGLGSDLVLQLVELAREREYHQVCALTLRPNFFQRLGFGLVDRWSISPKVWQACIYCPKFHRCDEVAVLIDLHGSTSSRSLPISKQTKEVARQPGWNHLLKYDEWQPLRLAYQYQDKEKQAQN